MASSGFLLCKQLCRPLGIKPSTPLLYNPNIKKYSQSSSKQNQGVKERAPSTADEFRRVAEEKAKAEETAQVTDQGGITSQTFDKTSHGSEEAATGRGDTEAVKERHKEHEPGSDYRRRG